MTVWLVEEAWGTTTVGVFSTKARAEAAKERANKAWGGKDLFLVYEMELDEEETV